MHLFINPASAKIAEEGEDMMLVMTLHEQAVQTIRVPCYAVRFSTVCLVVRRRVLGTK